MPWTIRPNDEDTSQRKGGVGPSYEELMKEMNLTANAIVMLTKRCIERGHLKKIPRTPRTLKVVKERASA